LFLFELLYLVSVRGLGAQWDAKPAWFDAAFVLAIPGMFIIPIPIVGSLIVGGCARVSCLCGFAAGSPEATLDRRFPNNEDRPKQ
jgi:hypothetical protein